MGSVRVSSCRCWMFGCVCYFAVECNGVVECGWRCSIK